MFDKLKVNTQNALANGVAVLIAVQIAMNVLRVGSNLIITRLMAPEDFGILGIVLSLTIVLQLATDMGFAAFIIRSKNTDAKNFLDVIWTIRFCRSIVLTVIMFLGAGAFADLLAKPELEVAFRAAAFAFLAEGIETLFFIRAERERRVTFVTLVEFGIFLVQIAATIIFAIILKSFWAVIISMYVRVALKALLSYVLFSRPYHRFMFDKEIALELWRFARFVVPSSVITIILSHADKVVLTRLLKLDQLGLYMLASGLTMSGMVLLIAYVSRVLLPLYAQIAREEPDRLRAVYSDSKRYVTLGLAFVFGGGIGGGPLIAQILFDERYLGSGIYISVLCLIPFGALFSYPAEQVVIALGRIRSAVEANLTRLAFLAVAAPIGYYGFGIFGMVVAFSTIEFAAATYWWTQLAKYQILNASQEGLLFVAGGAGAIVGYGSYILANNLIALGYLPQF